MTFPRSAHELSQWNAALLAGYLVVAGALDAGPVPAILVCHGPNGRRWFRRHRDLPEHWFPQDTLDADSYASEVLTWKIERSHYTRIGADAWFDRYDASRYEIIEQSIRIGESVLTFLVIEDGDMLEDAGAGPDRRW